MKPIRFKQIGIIHSPFKKPEGTPIQPTAARGIEGSVEIFQEFTAGLRDLDGFSHIILLYCFHMAKESALEVKPFMDDKTHGVFATRAPKRPNPLGISIVRLLGIEDGIIRIRDLDIVEGTPLIDIKPYVPVFDDREEIRTGWLEDKADQLSVSKDDGRFIK